MKDNLKKTSMAMRFTALLAVCVMVVAMTSCSEEKKELGPDEYDVVVIGSGGGGLSAASVLAQEGMKVIVIEQHYQVGGFMSSFSRKGYTFEASLDAMDKSGIDMFEKLGIKDKVTVVETRVACQPPRQRLVLLALSQDFQVLANQVRGSEMEVTRWEPAQQTLQGDLPLFPLLPGKLLQHPFNEICRDPEDGLHRPTRLQPR